MFWYLYGTWGAYRRFQKFYPTTCLPYLGFIVDSDLLELCLLREKQEKVLSLLSHWSEGRPGTKRELLSLVGLLQHCTQAILLGPPFLHRLIAHSVIDHAHSVKRIHHYVKLSTWGKDDIQWWFQLISKWNGKSLFIYFQVGSRALIVLLLLMLHEVNPYVLEGIKAQNGLPIDGQIIQDISASQWRKWYIL